MNNTKLTLPALPIRQPVTPTPKLYRAMKRSLKAAAKVSPEAEAAELRKIEGMLQGW